LSEAPLARAARADIIRQYPAPGRERLRETTKTLLHRADNARCGSNGPPGFPKCSEVTVTYAEAQPYSGKRVQFKTDADYMDADLPTGGHGLVWWVDQDAVMLEVAPYRPKRGWAQ